MIDLYITVKTEKSNSTIRNIITIVSLLLIFSFNIHDFSVLYQKILWDISVLLLIFTLYYNVLIHKSLPILSQKTITNIGGMCYSIYLLHFVIISFVGNHLMRFSFSNNQLINLELTVGGRLLVCFNLVRFLSYPFIFHHGRSAQIIN